LNREDIGGFERESVGTVEIAGQAPLTYIAVESAGLIPGAKEVFRIS